eukprot:TRINITY_DN924_c0_g1_i2.p1 TRINITY_DN924_c0_g1~~TRINITY_DN924_c0_g1_i2.p1  ORF type:complete len:188 (-),score=42.96 TRINITY_DN924_c0_g1_i2:376-939(-)
MEYDNEEYNWQPFLDVDAPFPGQVSPYATTVDETLTDIFSCLELKKEKDAIVDLGSGDGKIIHYAAIKYGIFGLGLDINPDLVAKAQRISTEQNVSHITQFLLKSFLDEDFDFSFCLAGQKRYPTVITMYLLPEALELLRPKLEEYVKSRSPNNNIIVISVLFKMEKWKPKRISDRGNVFYYNITSF